MSAPPPDDPIETIKQLIAERFAEHVAETDSERDSIYQQAMDEAQWERQWERLSTDRLRAYADVVEVLAVVLYGLPMSPDDAVPMRRKRIDPIVRNAMEQALRDIAADIQRITRFTGPRPAGQPAKTEDA